LSAAGPVSLPGEWAGLNAIHHLQTVAETWWLAAAPSTSVRVGRMPPPMPTPCIEWGRPCLSSLSTPARLRPLLPDPSARWRAGDGTRFQLAEPRNLDRHACVGMLHPDEDRHERFDRDARVAEWEEVFVHGPDAAGIVGPAHGAVDDT